ncbi:MAG: cyclic-phosphate processing receiver domain-containing protein [Vitreimonas sp.]
MAYWLFLDDTRDPPRIWPQDAVVVRNSAEFAAVLRKRGCPECISFDHDLGPGEPTGMDCARLFIEWVLDGRERMHPDFAFRVHSMNPPGKANIEALMGRFVKAFAAGDYGTVRQAIGSTKGGGAGSS